MVPSIIIFGASTSHEAQRKSVFGTAARDGREVLIFVALISLIRSSPRSGNFRAKTDWEREACDVEISSA